jgi:protein gp37
VSDRNPRLHQTGIPYLDAVWNVVTGCGDERLSPGCQHCYARAMTRRNLWGYDFEPLFHESRLRFRTFGRDRRSATRRRRTGMSGSCSARRRRCAS